MTTLIERAQQAERELQDVAFAITRRKGPDSVTALCHKAADTIAELVKEIEALKHDIERHIKIASEYAADAERYRFARQYISIEDVEQWRGMRKEGHQANEWESDKTDAAIDATKEQRNG